VSDISLALSDRVAVGMVLAALFALLPSCSLDRHRGSGCPLPPATPPRVRVRTRRFEEIDGQHQVPTLRSTAGLIGTNAYVG
jgi:hypothetical protein